MSQAADPIPRRKLSHEVLARMRTRIQSGEFAPGSQLPSERDLMIAYAVGRPAVREAMQSLARDGMISISHGERARVVVPEPASLASGLSSAVAYMLQHRADALVQLKEARLIFEAGLVRAAAERADDAGIARLRLLAATHREGPLDAFLANDIAFHCQIAVMTGNAIVPVALETILQWLSRHYRPLLRAPGAEAVTLNEHEAIVAAVAARDPGAAEAAMVRHLRRASALYEEAG